VRIEELPLPQKIIKHLKRIGYNSLYPPQEEAIKKGVLEGKNIILSTPTASGKTLIAILTFLKRLNEDKNGKYIYLVPLKALANEKYEEFKKHLNIEIKGRKPRIAIATGDYDTPGEELKNADVIIATNEKMDSLLRHMPSWISKIKVMVVDEGHLIGIHDRGPILESLISRLKTDYPHIQIIVLSATITNSIDYSKWINGEVVKMNWRPVPLKEGVLYDHITILSDYTEYEIPKYVGDPIIDKTIHTLREGGQVIIFTRTRNEAKRKAKRLGYYISKYFNEIYTGREKEELIRLKRYILERGEKTKLSETLAQIVEKGVAFHHAGLNPTHRILLENAFRNGYLKILTATPTLAAGVNLPSRVVIITYTSRRGFGGYQEDISVFEYKQMAGRAGRPQYDEYGEALIYSRHENLVDIIIDNYILNEPEPIYSHLLEDEYPDIFILSIATALRNIDDSRIDRYIKNTLTYLQNNEKNISRIISRSLKRLIEGELISFHEIRGRIYYKPTVLGTRASELYIFPSTAIYLWKISSENKSLPTILLLYHICNTKDMPKLSLRKRDYKQILNEINRLGVGDEYVASLNNTLYLDIYEDELAIWKTALVLHDWILEKSEEEILEKWGVEPGDLYVLYSTGEWLAYSAKEISLIRKNRQLAKEYNKLTYRLKYGVKEELIPLVLIPGIGRRRARILYNHGFKNILDLRKARYEELISIPGIGMKLAKQILENANKNI